MTKRLVVMIFSVTLLIISMTACHTVKGAGQDIESVGAAISGD